MKIDYESFTAHLLDDYYYLLLKISTLRNLMINDVIAIGCNRWYG